MNQIKPLDQVILIGANTHNHAIKVVNKFGSRDSILYKLKEFSSSVPDFRRSDKGNIRHRLDDIIMLMILARASKCVGRTEIIEFGRHNLKKFRQLGMLKNGVPSHGYHKWLCPPNQRFLCTTYVEERCPIRGDSLPRGTRYR